MSTTSSPINLLVIQQQRLSAFPSIGMGVTLAMVGALDFVAVLKPDGWYDVIKNKVNGNTGPMSRQDFKDMMREHG